MGRFRIMKRMLTALLIVGLWLAAVNAQTKSDRERDRLFGLVQTVTTEVAEFTVKDGKSVEGARMRLHEVSYDTRGNRVKRVDFNHDGSAAQTIVYNYDAEGRSTGYEDYASG